MSDARSASILQFLHPEPAAEPADTVASAEALGRAAAEAELGPRIAGLEAALAAAQAAADTDRLEAARIAAEAMAALETVFAEQLSALALAVARRVLAAEPAIGTETLAALVRDALAALPAGAAGTLFLPPAQLAQAPVLPAGWALAADAGLARGDVRAEAGEALARAGLDLRLAQVADTPGEAA